MGPRIKADKWVFRLVKLFPNKKYVSCKSYLSQTIFRSDYAIFNYLFIGLVSDGVSYRFRDSKAGFKSFWASTQSTTLISVHTTINSRWKHSLKVTKWDNTKDQHRISKLGPWSYNYFSLLEGIRQHRLQ